MRRWLKNVQSAKYLHLQQSTDQTFMYITSETRGLPAVELISQYLQKNVIDDRASWIPTTSVAKSNSHREANDM